MKKNGQIVDEKVRQSGIELYRIIGMLLICISHCAHTMEEIIDIYSPTVEWQVLMFRIFRYCGTLGNLAFVICASYFFVGNRKVHKIKVINLLLDSQTISVGMLILLFAVSRVFSFGAFSVSPGMALVNFFPDLFETVWFVPCYILLYVFHPGLDYLVSSLSQKKHFGICLVLFVVYGLGALVNLLPAFSRLLGFIIVYFVVAYIKLYCQNFVQNKKKNLVGFLSVTVLFLLAVILKNYVALKIAAFKDIPNYEGLTSVFLLPMMLFLFHLFARMQFKCRFVNYIASCSLFFYCFHDNELLRTYFRPEFYQRLIAAYGGNSAHLAVYFFLLFVVLFLFGIISSVIYRETVHKLVVRVSRTAEKTAEKLCDTVFSFLHEKE